MKQQDKDRLIRERAEHKKRKASELSTLTPPIDQVTTGRSVAEMSQTTQDSKTSNTNNTNSGNTIMGGRNECANSRRN